MITMNDLKKAVLLSTKEEYARQLSALSEITAIDLSSYRKVLDMIDQAASELPDIEWVQGRISQARDAAVNGWAYR